MQLGLRPGDDVEFDVQNGTAVLHKKKKKLPFEKYRGALGQWKTDEIMEELR